MRAKVGSGSTMTCAAHVQAVGQGFRGQLGVIGDEHLEGLARLAKRIRNEQSVAMIQLHHAGMRATGDLPGGVPVYPSDHEETGARARSLEEVEGLCEDFIAAAVRAERAGFDGVELRGAHGYVLGQFFSSGINRRDDRYGGSLENRLRILFNIIQGIRERCGAGFVLGVRLSAERFGIDPLEMREVAQRLMNEGQIDFLDMSLWDVFKEPADEQHRGRSLLSYFTELDRGNVRLGVAGKIRSAEDATACLGAGCDFVLLGRVAILHHDFPARARRNPDFRSVSVPVSADYLRAQGLGEAFVAYMSTWNGFVETPASGG
jgi:2,4-dienoyl-CoA reductase-like NADH-dependent reductase (Old Yellow Enzyme family)